MSACQNKSLPFHAMLDYDLLYNIAITTYEHTGHPPHPIGTRQLSGDMLEITTSICAVFPIYFCTFHQNVKLMMAGGKRESLIDDGLKHYRHCISAIQCNPPNIEWYSGTESLIYFIYLFVDFLCSSSLCMNHM